MTIQELIQAGRVRFAKLPPQNGNASFVRQTLPLLAGDYPAKTAVMWNTAYKEFGIEAQNTMIVADPKDVELILDTFRSDSHYEGGGAGTGFKEVVLPHLDEITPKAEVIGAVNIIKKENGRLIGDNTDGEGYAVSLEQLFAKFGRNLRGVHILMLGAGGSGRGIAFSLAQCGAQLTILNRTVQKAIDLAQSINREFPDVHVEGGGREKIAEVLPLQDAVISVIDDENSPLDAYSTLGKMRLPVTPESIKENRKSAEKLLSAEKRTLIVSDIRIRKEMMPMLTQAQALGLPILDGRGMVVNQGVAAFWWLYEKELLERSLTIDDVTSVMSKAAGLDTN